MDEQHLADLAALARLLRDAGGTREETRAMLDAVPALVAEVRRLRAIEAAAWVVLRAHEPYPDARWAAGTPLDGLARALRGAA